MTVGLLARQGESARVDLFMRRVGWLPTVNRSTQPVAVESCKHRERYSNAKASLGNDIFFTTHVRKWSVSLASNPRVTPNSSIATWRDGATVMPQTSSYHFLKFRYHLLRLSPGCLFIFQMTSLIAGQRVYCVTALARNEASWSLVGGTRVTRKWPETHFKNRAAEQKNTL